MEEALVRVDDFSFHYVFLLFLFIILVFFLIFLFLLFRFGIDEGRILSDNEAIPLASRAIGQTYQASFDALLFDLVPSLLPRSRALPLSPLLGLSAMKCDGVRWSEIE